MERLRQWPGPASGFRKMVYEVPRAREPNQILPKRGAPRHARGDSELERGCLRGKDEDASLVDLRSRCADAAELSTEQQGAVTQQGQLLTCDGLGVGSDSDPSGYGGGMRDVSRNSRMRTWLSAFPRNSQAPAHDCKGYVWD